LLAVLAVCWRRRRDGERARADDRPRHARRRYSEASAVNDLGQVVGLNQLAGGVGHAFSWTKAGGMIDLGTLGGSFTKAEAVNDAGLVVGISSTAGNLQQHAVIWQVLGTR
jgi:probable HAF family extracellular repeat protein